MGTILVVDDAAAERIRVGGLLKRTGRHIVLSANDGQQALDVLHSQILNNQPVDLVLTDLRMPEMDGLQLTRSVRNAWPGLPVVLMTAAGSEEIAVAAMLEGAASYINKTSSPRFLVETVERVLDLRVRDQAQTRIQQHIRREEYEFCLNNDRMLMSATARFLRDAMLAFSLCPEKELIRVGVAIEEALLNACLHGNLELDSKLREEGGDLFEALAEERARRDPWRRRCVFVRAQLTPEQAVIVAEDEGPGFNVQNVPDPTEPENLLKPHGRGIMMMRLFLDSVSWNAQGNQVTMIKNAGNP